LAKRRAPDKYAVYSIPGLADPFSSLSHLIGALVFAWLAFYLIRLGRGNGGHAASLSVFAFSSVFMLSMSGVYHMLMPGGTARLVLKRLNHAAIFFLIAGTFTPILIILFRDWWRWIMLGVIWIAAVTGLVLKTLFFSSLDALGVALYLGLGWLGAVPGILLWQRFGFGFVAPLLWGGLAYTIGALVESVDKPVLIPGVIGAHELFHVAVLIGLAFQWYFIYQLAEAARVARNMAPRSDLTALKPADK
jgi:channel protein (hemolysin III family)